MVRNSRSFVIGLVLLVSFIGIYFYIMSPSFGNGRNGLEYADDMFNSLSKGSAYFIPEETKKAHKQDGKEIAVNLKAKDSKEAEKWARLYTLAGARAEVNDVNVKVQGDLGKIMVNVLEDCDAMYFNKGDQIQSKYGLEPRAALYAWYQSFKAMDNDFKKQQMFKESSAINSVMKKALEPAYNYYGVEIKHVRDNKASVSIMLIFYLLYTVWYGAAIYYLCEGFGLTTSKPVKKAEV
ncbi:MAG: hypothetical protein ACOY81_02325 [Bacillota bacterium]|uniref:hypothetical protein n=1 Tax=Desulfurispora thermophila TaxID=265470 RepID=UPI00037D0877|nr:hypothetical protein [Desulfurispora thermophila]